MNVRTGRTNHAPGTHKTSLREILQLIPLQTRSIANENLSPCEPHGICLISGNQQTTSYWCPIQMSHQNSPLYLLIKYDHIDTFYMFQVHSNTLYCSRTNPGNITESKTDIAPIQSSQTTLHKRKRGKQKVRKFVYGHYLG